MRRKTSPIVISENLSVCFGNFCAVDDVSFSVYRGEIFGFLGANGAGKTTTIRVLCGLIPASRGHVEIDGIVATDKNLIDIKRKSGYMSQRFTLYDGLTVAENFEFAAALRQMPVDEYLRRRDELLKFIGFNRGMDTLVKNLPGGIKQEVALSICLLHNPAIIFLDEPTAGVAPAMRMRFWGLIKKLSKMGQTVFVTTHYMDEAENCTRIALMRAGKIVAIGVPDNLKKTTFGGVMYNMTPRVKNPKLPSNDVVEIIQPYGRHYHVIFRNGVDVGQFNDFDIAPITPSLEDVFIKIVEGGRV